MPDSNKVLCDTGNVATRKASDQVPLNRTGEAMARDGYSVLERANRSDPANRHLKGLAPPVTDDRPDIGYNER